MEFQNTFSKLFGTPVLSEKYARKAVSRCSDRTNTCLVFSYFSLHEAKLSRKTKSRFKGEAAFIYFDRVNFSQ